MGSREVIKSNRQTKNTMADQNFVSARLTSNLYDDDIDLFGFNVIGPTHPEALNYYDFRIVERQLLDTKTVFVISVTPKSKLQPSFVGTIAVLDEDYAMIDVDLKPNEAIMFPPPLNRFEFAIEQKFSNFGGEYWLPVDVRVKGEIKIKLPGLEFPAIKYSQLTRLSDYEVNIVLPDSLFQKKKKSVQVAVSNESVSVETVADDDNDEEISVKDTFDAGTVTDNAESDNAADAGIPDCTADVKATSDNEIITIDKNTAKEPAPANTDSLFAHDGNVIPLTEEEKEAYSTIDSTMTMEKSFKPKGVLARLIKEDKDKKQKINQNLLKHSHVLSQVSARKYGITEQKRITWV